ncbi:MAG: universal stress protein [Fibrobacteria bacterium]
MQQNTARQFQGLPKVVVAGDRLRVELAEGPVDLPMESLPERYIEWIEQGRRAMYDKLLGKGNPAFFTSHLPVMITQARGQTFPFNCGNKGVGFLPKREYLESYVNLFKETIERTRGRPWQESLQERLKAVSSFYFDREKVDYRSLSSLEIFEKTTFRNISATPLAALHYTGNAPDYISFQVNAAVEVIGPEDPRHEFVKLARVMFEYDSFHIAQHEFPYAYVFWISSIHDKTPFRVPEKDGKIVMLPSKGGMEWEPEAIESINRAPGMIRQFITEQIEKYAKGRGFTRITMELMKEAREVLERPKDAGTATAATLEAAAATAPSAPSAIAAAAAPATVTAIAAEAAEAVPATVPSFQAPGSHPDGEAAPKAVDWKYSRIYVGLDSSVPSNEAMRTAMLIGKREGARMIGSHVYAAKMHDNRFRAMEGGLPEEFQKEKELNRQRKIHDSLITKGLELITDSYLEAMSGACKTDNLEFAAVSLEGKNWKAMAEDIAANDYDLVALGAHGVGRVGNSQLGTVAERMLRRVRRDVLLTRMSVEENVSDTIIVCLDGSIRSWGGLQRAMRLAKTLDKKVLAVSAFDPYFHYAMFKSLNKTLTEKARKVFKFEEQEKLHEDIIDSGLAKIYQSYLNIAKRLAEEAGVAIEIRLLDGKPFEKILQLVKAEPPWLLVVGRIGFHSDEDMDIGGNTENLCRLAPCNILVVDSKAKPPVEFQAEETVSWTTEAKARMQRVPAMAQNMAMKAIQNYCVAEGHTVVTESILNAALKTLLPPAALARMGIVDTDEGKERDSHDKIALSFKCQACGHVHHGSRPQSCPICGMGGHMFKLLESAIVSEGQSLETLGDRQLMWEKSALALLEKSGDATVTAQIRNRLEKRALTQRITAVTLEMVEAELRAAGIGAAPTAVPTTADLAPAAPVSAAEAAPGAISSDAFGGPAWTEDAVKRLERVPDGFMRKAAKNMVEEHALNSGTKEITLEVAEAGLGKAREKMHASMTGSGQGDPGAHGHIHAHGVNPHAHGQGANPHAATPSADPARTSAQASATPEASDASEIAPWECHLCGIILDGAKPTVCANCGTGHFVRLSAEKRAQAKSSAFKTLAWKPEALQRLERVPEGFMRTMTRCRVEKWARAGGADVVDLEIMDGKYGSWGDGSAKMAPELEWSEAATARTSRIPDFIRPMVMKEIERRAKGEGRTRVDAADIDQAMTHWSASGNFHGHG